MSTLYTQVAQSFEQAMLIVHEGRTTIYYDLAIEDEGDVLHIMNGHHNNQIAVLPRIVNSADSYEISIRLDNITNINSDISALNMILALPFKYINAEQILTYERMPYRVNLVGNLPYLKMLNKGSFIEDFMSPHSEGRWTVKNKNHNLTVPLYNIKHLIHKNAWDMIQSYDKFTDTKNPAPAKKTNPVFDALRSM